MDIHCHPSVHDDVLLFQRWSVNLGIDTFTIKSNLCLSAAQRLVPLLCNNCALSLSDEDIREIKGHLDGRDLSPLRKINTEGCSHCQSGIKDRKAILEYMDKGEINHFLGNSIHGGIIPKHSLKSAALVLAEEGRIDVFEVLSFT